MNLNNPVTPGAVWAVSPRTLTGLGGALVQGTSGTFITSIAAGASVSLRPASTTVWLITVSGHQIVGATYSLRFSDGTSFAEILRGAADASIVFTGVSRQLIFISLANIGTTNGTYSFTIFGLVS